MSLRPQLQIPSILSLKHGTCMASPKSHLFKKSIVEKKELVIFEYLVVKNCYLSGSNFSRSVASTSTRNAPVEADSKPLNSNFGFSGNGCSNG